MVGRPEGRVQLSPGESLTGQGQAKHQAPCLLAEGQGRLTGLVWKTWTASQKDFGKAGFARLV